MIELARMGDHRLSVRTREIYLGDGEVPCP